MQPDLEQKLRARYAELRAALPWDEAARSFAEHGWTYCTGQIVNGSYQHEAPTRADLEEAADHVFEACLGNLEHSWSLSQSGRFVVVVWSDGRVRFECEAIGDGYAEIVEWIDSKSRAADG